MLKVSKRAGKATQQGVLQTQARAASGKISLADQETFGPEFPPIKYNMNPGPGILPAPVMERLQREFLDFKGLGVPWLHMSHRMREYMMVTEALEEDFRAFMKVPDNFKLFLMNGGGSLQFSAIPQNLTGHKYGKGAAANYLMSGAWTYNAGREAAKFCDVNYVNKWTLPEVKDLSVQKTMLDLDNWHINKDAEYFYMCQNETIEGFEYDQALTRKMIDRVRADAPNQVVISDMSSCIGSKDITKHGLMEEGGYDIVFGGAHKNFGTPGLTFMFIRDEVMDRVQANRSKQVIPFGFLLDWNVYNDMGKAYFPNTPGSMAILMTHYICDYSIKAGGISYWEDLTWKRSAMIYEEFDRSAAALDSGAQPIGFRCYVDPAIRSTMNQTFEIECVKPEMNAAVEADFLHEARQAGFCGLGGHQFRGGLRSTTYNAFSLEMTQAYVDFLREYCEVIGKKNFAAKF